MKFLILILSFSASTVFAAPELAKTVRALTKKTVVVRGNVEKCSTAAPPEFSAQQLELEFATALSKVKPTSMTAESWQKLNARNCIQDCSCYALSQIYSKYPKKVRKQISDKKLQKSLAQMTDKDYLRCFRKAKNICLDPEVAAMVKAIEVSYR